MKKLLVGPFIATALLVGMAQGASATKPNPEHKVTICHRTDSYSNPYVQIAVDVASILGSHGHDGHNGPVFYPGIPKHTKWGDIIPAFNFGPGEQYSGKNILGGAIILDNGCHFSEETTTTQATTTTQPNEGGGCQWGCETTTTQECCGCTCETTTTGVTTTTEATTTTTQPQETTTEATSTTQPPKDTTTMATTTSTPGSSTTAPPGTTPPTGGETTTMAPPGPQPLPFTGSGSGPLIFTGLSLCGVGTFLASRKRRFT